MFVRVQSFALLGVDAVPVAVEVDVSNGLPTFEVVGLPASSVRESRERVRAAIRNSGAECPPRRITVSLAPADLRKEGAGFDLPIALGLLAATGQCPADRLAGVAAVGELALDGSVRPVPGLLPMAVAAREAGCRLLLAPAAAAGQAALAGLAVVPVADLKAALDWVRGTRALSPAAPAGPAPAAAPPADLADVRGQAVARRALAIAAAGGHNLFLLGPPGTGKSLLARCLPGILPPLSLPEALEVTRIYSAAGLDPGGLVEQRPFRAPHHSASRQALLGGGTPPRPGEVSLAHRGVLFLDELPEFARDVLEGLRQPLEEGVVRMARAAWRLTFPARCQVVAAANPCPCGYLGDERRPCTCPPGAAARYQQRVSGPLLDRFDLFVTVSAPDPAEWAVPGEPSAAVAARVREARERQQHRLAPLGVACNADLAPRDLARVVRLPPAAEELLRRSVAALGLSLRARDRILRVARTIADLEGAAEVQVEHVAEAIQYRRPTG